MRPRSRARPGTGAVAGGWGGRGECSVWEDDFLEVDGGDGPDFVKMYTCNAGRDRELEGGQRPRGPVSEAQLRTCSP